MHLTTAAVTCFHLSCGMERGWIKEEKYLLQHLVHVVCKQVVESAHCLLRWVSQGCQSGRPMVKLFTKDPQPCALPRTARPLLDGPLDRLRLGTDGTLTSLLFNSIIPSHNILVYSGNRHKNYVQCTSHKYNFPIR